MTNYKKWYLENRKYFEENEAKKVIRKIEKDLKLKNSKTAENYYFKIRNEYLSGYDTLKENLANSSLKLIKKDKNSLYLRGRYSDYIKKPDSLVAGEIIFTSEAEIHEWAKEEVSNFMNNVVKEIIYAFKIEV